MPQQRIIERVPRFVRGERADHRMAEQIEVADCVEHLVLDEFVVVAQPVVIEHTVLIEHDCIVERSAER